MTQLMGNTSAIQLLERSYFTVNFQRLSVSEIEITHLDEVRLDAIRPDLSKSHCVVHFDEFKNVINLSLVDQTFKVANPKHYTNYPSFSEC
ncbi:hypothetical protein [Vibrio sp. TBV020]|uniref:hypothetical protein n=1 Tax=Vibrio sp. TBV020 TaxID=3137398 RepID=UPI0038CD2305